MNYIKFTDWQELGLKKDVEEICRNTKTKQPLIITTCIEIALATVSLMYQYIGDDERLKKILIYITIIAIPITLFIGFFIMFFHKIKDIRKSSKGFINVSDKINSFDNKVCSWAMMSTSYVDILENNSDNIDDDQILFLYQEINYYINKCIDEIYSTLPVVGKVYSNDCEKVRCYKYISLARLYNIIHILNYHRPKIEDNTSPNIIIKIGDDNSNSSFQVSISNSSENNEIINFQKNINDAYDKNLKDFTDIIKLYFPESGLFR